MSASFPYVETPKGIKTANRAATMALFGLVGGLLGFALSKMVDDGQGIDSEAALRAHTGFWFMWVMIGIGAVLLAGHAYLSKAAPSGQSMVTAAVAFLVFGFLSGYLAQMIYTQMLDLEAIYWCEDIDCYASEVRPARTVAWALSGLLGGAGIGLSFRSAKRVQNALLGGALGGLLGGLMFDTIPQMFDGSSEGVSQAVGIMLIGGLMGAFMSVIDSARAGMWLEVISGEGRGRQFLVMDQRTSVGMARTANVCIPGDRGIREIHLWLDRTPNGAVFTCATADGVLHNGHQAGTGQVGNGDVLRIGSTDVRVGIRKGGVPVGAALGAPPPASNPGVAPRPAGRPTATQANDLAAGRPASAPPPTPSYGAAPPPPPMAPGGPGSAPPPPPGAPPAAPRVRPRIPTKD